MCIVNGHFLWCISATSAFLVSCFGRPFLTRESLCPGSTFCSADGKWQPNNLTLRGEEIMLPWTFRSHASSFHRALPFQKPLRHLALHLRSSSSLPHQPPPPPRPACLIKLLFRKWCSCAPSSSARGCPGNPLSLSSSLSPLPSPMSLVRVSPLLFIFRATTCEQLPDFSPVVTLQSE